MDVGGMLRTKVLSMAGISKVEEKAIGWAYPNWWHIKKFYEIPVACRGLFVGVCLAQKKITQRSP